MTTTGGDRRGATRGDLAIAAAIFVGALALRLVGFDGVGLQHYDEGVYASAAAAVRDGSSGDALAERLASHAPPLFPWAGGLIARATGARPSRVLFSFSIFAGAATALLAYALGLRAAGRAAAVVAGVLVACDPSLVMWSRTAMTDVVFLAAFLGAIFCAAEAERRRSIAYALAAGVVVGVAWNVKYHGWLALASAGAAAFLFAPATNGGEARRGRVGRFAATTAVAVCCALPFSLLRSGGDRRFLAPEHWLRSLATQAGYLAEGPEAYVRLGVALAAVAGLVVAPLRRKIAADPHGAVVLAAAGILALATPAYRPYPRLATAWTATASIAAAVVLARALPRPSARNVAAGAVVVGAIFSFWTSPREVVGARSDGFERAVERIAESIAPGEKIAVLGEPAAAAALRERGFDARYVDRQDDVFTAFPDATETCFVSGYFARKERSFEAWEVARGLKSLKTTTAPVASRDVRRMDDFPPSELRSPAAEDPETYALDLRRTRLK